MEIKLLTYNIHGLPWTRTDTEAIAHWLPTTGADIFCFQEVFTEHARKILTDRLAVDGFQTVVPRDDGVTFFSSGLLFAFRTSIYELVADCFQPFLDIHTIEWTANKGFHCVTLQHRHSRLNIILANTHTLSDNELGWVCGYKYFAKLRKKQFDQIVDYFRTARAPVLSAGDMNCEISPHPHLRFLHPITGNLLHKSTFFSTGEDLDHVGWLPLQWAPPGCSFCDVVRRGPRLLLCKVFQKPWSDHAPVYCAVRIPEIATTPMSVLKEIATHE